MCSVVGYIGKNFSSTFVFEGLARLEYRGYDAAGFACLNEADRDLLCIKASGQLSNLLEKIKNSPIDGSVGIGHTRWSTHGDFSVKNAHPHFDCKKAISVVHNGTIENHHLLRVDLEHAGHLFESLTDTEVIPHLFESILRTTVDLKEAVCSLVSLLDGMYSAVIMMRDFSDVLIAIRKRSPLCIGYGDGEMFIASDSLAFAGRVELALFLPDESFALVYKNHVQLYDFFGMELPQLVQSITSEHVMMDKAGYEHFMLKEIEEQPAVIVKTVKSLSDGEAFLWDQIGVSADQIKKIRHIVLIGCGTSWHAACIARFFFEMVCGLPVTVLLASECRYSSFFPDVEALYIFISQSGETADTLEALRLIQAYDLKTIALTNVSTSAIVREARGFLLTHAGVEISVASTKAFSTQLTVLYWFAHRIAYECSATKMDDMAQVEKDIVDASSMLDCVLHRYRSAIELTIVPSYSVYDKALFLGKHISYPFAMESALKLKEIGYVFAQAYPAGELKHGALALVDNTVPVYIFSHADVIIYQKILLTAHAVHSRGGKIIAFAYEGQHELCSLAEHYFVIPATGPPLLGPLVMTGLMQFLMYSLAKHRGCPIDKPRNLAKSVTVE